KLNGVGDGKFAPDNSVTRGEFVKMISNVLNLPKPETIPEFKDVNPDDWYYEAVSMASEKGYVVGFNEMFNPNDPISRQDIAVIINRVILDKNVDIMLGEKKSFTDADDISDYAIKAVENMQAVA
ncbi:MAG: S-layer homology domain-containing protein, partial [Oscillospiraceae bacterium]